MPHVCLRVQRVKRKERNLKREEDKKLGLNTIWSVQH